MYTLMWTPFSASSGRVFNSEIADEAFQISVQPCDVSVFTASRNDAVDNGNYYVSAIILHTAIFVT